MTEFFCKKFYKEVLSLDLQKHILLFPCSLQSVNRVKLFALKKKIGRYKPFFSALSNCYCSVVMSHVVIVFFLVSRFLEVKWNWMSHRSSESFNSVVSSWYSSFLYLPVVFSMFLKFLLSIWPHGKSVQLIKIGEN